MSSSIGLLDQVGHPADNAAAELVRELARQGTLADRAATAFGAEQTRLSGGAYDIVWRVVFQRLTRRIELGRGHHTCASSVHRLEPECLDRFQDDVEAALDDLLRHARVPILNLEGWIGSRLNAATVDGYRRRRGERGALQRPRLPGWLGEALGQDPWLTALAVEILVWVGIPTTAGLGIWPLDAWAERRSAITGCLTSGDQVVVTDIERVLAAMRQRGKWYADFVERPLGRKQAPVLPLPRTAAETLREPTHLALRGRHETDDARLVELAGLAVAAIESGIRRRAELRSTVVEVLRTVFGSGTGAEHLDRAPGTGTDERELVVARLADPVTVDRIVSVLLGTEPHPIIRAEPRGAR